jgi:acyl-CoA synthetase (NDP forming)
LSARSSFLAAGFALTEEARRSIRDEGIAIVAQSGAVAACVLAMAQQAGLPVGTYFATGNECDVSTAEVIQQMAEDDSVRVILLYLEGLRDGPHFLRAADLARAHGKVVVALKVGASEAGARVSISHTAALAGDDAAYDGLFRQHAIVRAASATALVDLGRVVRAVGPAVGRRVGVLSFSGGISVMLTDALTSRGFQMPAWSPASTEAMRAELPAYASVQNPVDGTGALTATPETLERVLRAAHGDPGTDVTVLGLGILHAKEAVLADAILRASQGVGKPLLVAWLGGAGVAAVRLGASGVPVFTDVPDLARALGSLADAGRLSEDFRRAPDRVGPAHLAADEAQAILDTAWVSGATALDEVEARRLLAAGGIETVREVVVRTPAAVRPAMSTLSLPLVAKLASATLAHKSDVNAVRLGLGSVPAVEDAATELLALAANLGLADATVVLQEQVSGGSELLLGMKRDATFGPLVVIGPGGVLAEALEDVAIGGAPLTVSQAEQLLASLRHRKLIAGFRGRPTMMTAGVAQAIRCFSELIAVLPDSVLSVDVNPVIVRHDGTAVAVDALIEIAAEGQLRPEVAG